MMRVLPILGLLLVFSNLLSAGRGLDLGNSLNRKLSESQKSENKKLIDILTCKFDATQAPCTPKIKASGATPSYSAAPASSQTVGTYKITDVSSITLPAANGEYCQIPFTEANVEYYHCRNLGDCRTSSGVLSKCASGQFHYAKPGAKFEPYTVEFMFPTINLPEPGSYLAKFYVLMYCNKAGCEEALDFIGFNIKDANNNASIVNNEYVIDDLEMEKKWIQKEVEFEAITDKINLAFNLGRLDLFSASNLLAFDQLELYQVKDSSLTTDDSHTTGSSSPITSGETETTSYETSELSSNSPTERTTEESTLESSATTHQSTDHSSSYSTAESTTEREIESSSSSLSSAGTDGATTSNAETSTDGPFTSTSESTSSSELTSIDKSSDSTEVSTLMSQSSATTNEQGSVVEEVNVYTCNFDSTQAGPCTPKIKTNGSTPLYSIITTSGQIVGTYRITDVSSITLPAANGEYCQIPFTEASVEYYHCRSAGTDCRTASGAFAKCASGLFHYAKPGTKLEPYTAEFLFPTITLPEPGSYLAKFYILMYCNKAGCEEAQDFISLTVNDANNQNATVAYKEYKLTDLEMEKKWIQREVKFKASTNKINLLFYVGRRVLFGTSNIIGFDQLELYQLKGSNPATTGLQTSTTDSDKSTTNEDIATSSASESSSLQSSSTSQTSTDAETSMLTSLLTTDETSVSTSETSTAKSSTSEETSSQTTSDAETSTFWTATQTASFSSEDPFTATMTDATTKWSTGSTSTETKSESTAFATEASTDEATEFTTAETKTSSTLSTSQSSASSSASSSPSTSTASTSRSTTTSESSTTTEFTVSEEKTTSPDSTEQSSSSSTTTTTTSTPTSTSSSSISSTPTTPTSTSSATPSSTSTSSSSSTTSKSGGPTGEKVKILGCSFDVTDPLCALKFRTNGSAPTYSIIITSSQLVGSYKITDLTSITAPTANGEVCQIPYSDAGIDYFHCRNTANECRTTNGAFAKCAGGNFQYAKPGAKLEPYTVEFLLPTITIQEPGDYLAKFHILMLCNKDGCEEAQDYISLTVNDANNKNATVFYTEYKLTDLEMEKKWIQREVNFKITTEKINMLFNLGRRALFGTSNFLAFDQVELYLVKGGSLVTDEMGTTSNGEAITDETTTLESSSTSGSKPTDSTSSQSSSSASPSASTASTTVSSTSSSSSSSSASPSTSATTTTASSTTTTKDDGSNEVKLLGCSFDVTDASCNLKVRATGSTATYSSTSQVSQSVGTYKVTDVTSITTPTANGAVCQIPYSDLGTEYFHCRNAANECKTTSGAFAKCADGKFHYAKPGTANPAPYTIEYLFPTINLPEPGNFLAKFYILMLCNKAGCEQAEDYISLTVNDADKGNETVVYREFKLNDIEMEKKWIQYEVEFQTSTARINLLVHLGRRVLLSASNFLAFDQVELYRVKGSPGVTDDQKTTSEEDKDTTVSKSSTTTESSSTQQSSSSSSTASDTSSRSTATTTTTTTSPTSTTSRDGSGATDEQVSTSETPTGFTVSEETGASTDPSSSTPTSSRTTPTTSTATTTTSRSTATTTTRPFVLTESLFCDFNQLQNGQICEQVLLDKGNSTGRFEFTSSVFLTGTDHFITDVSSINNPTKSNKKCRIPFVYNKIEYEYCASVKGKFQCETVEDGELDECSGGRFLLARTSQFGESYESNMKVSLQNRIAGIYDAEFYVTMFCNSVNCKQASDFVSLSVAYTDMDPRSADFMRSLKREQVFTSVTHTTIGDHKRWVKFSGSFELDNSPDSKPWIIVRMGRKSQFDQVGFIGFDELQVLKSEKVSVPPPVTLELETTTTTQATTISPLKDEKKPDLTTILIAVLVPIVVVALMIGAFLVYLRRSRRPKLGRHRSSYASYDDNEYSYQPRLPIARSRSSKQYGSQGGIEMRESQIVDDSDIED